MEQQGIAIPTDITYCLLQECIKKKDLAAGRHVHSLIVRNGLDSIAIWGDHLIRFFASCGCLVEASRTFLKVSKRSIYTWNAIISGYANVGNGEKAMELYHKMQQDGVVPDIVTFLSTLKACARIGARAQGMRIHDHIIRKGVESGVAIGNTLVDMYARCGSQQEALRMFDGLQNQDVVSWGIMITVYAQNGHGSYAFKLFEEMQYQGTTPNRVTFLCILKACSSIEALEQGRLVHDHIIKVGVDSDLMVGNTLIDMYAKCFDLNDAHKVFSKLPSRDVVSWDAIIAGFVHYGDGLLALKFFEKMQQESIKPDKFTYSCILKACASEGATRHGMVVHDCILRCGLGSNIVVGNTLVDMYAKCGYLVEAYKVFDGLPNRDVVSWGAMTAGYVQQGFTLYAFELFEKMQQEGIMPNSVVFLFMLKACISVGALWQGRLLHDQIIRHELEPDVVVGSTIVDMYVKCGSLEDSQNAFDRMPKRNEVAWAVLIFGYIHHEQYLLAIGLFAKMNNDIKPGKVLFLSILHVCGKLGCLMQGRLVHDQIIRCGLESDVEVRTSLIDMYGKCGSLKEGHIILDPSLKGNVVSWGAMIGGYGRHGYCKLMGNCLDDMQHQGLKPDHAVYASILNACSNAGLLERGIHYFDSMREDHGIAPRVDHYNCIVDLLGRAGWLREAEDLLHSMPVAADIFGWMSLLSCCKAYSNTKLGRKVFDRILLLDPSDASGYMLMSTIYMSAYELENLKDILKLQKFASMGKIPGMAWIDVNNQLYEFVVGGKNHLQILEFSGKLKRVHDIIKQTGFVPILDLVLEPTLDEDEEHGLYMHHEELQIVYKRKASGLSLSIHTDC